MSRYAISDIHGHLSAFQRLLDRIQLSTSDELYLLGDYIDRGPESYDLIETIFDMQADGYQLHCLKGNHEAILIDLIEGMGQLEATNWYRLYGGRETIESYPEKEVLDYHINWMRDLPHYFDLGDYYLVHAGLNFKGGNPLHDKDAMLWARNWYAEINEQYLGGRTIVHGHTPVETNRIKTMASSDWIRPVIGIDAGCAYDRPGLGQLCAINLDTKEVVFEPR